jgi:hypothetical protein
MDAKIAKEWTDKQRVYMAWLALPAALREPKTQQAFADALEVDVTTLWRWRQQPAFRNEVRSILVDKLESSMSDVLDTIRRKAIDGDRDFVNFYFSILGGAQIVAGANATMNTANMMSEDEAMTLLEQGIGLRLTARVTDGGDQP